MSKNISVKVDGEATNLTVDKLRTNKQGGESMDWSPESDTDVSNLRVWRNGTYTADDMGVFGFDSIDVDITGHGGAGAELVGDPHTGESAPNDITIKEGNISRTMSGVQCLKVDKQGSGKQQFYNIETGTLSVTKEGTYKAKNDRKYAYTSVTVNVPHSGGGGGGGGDPYAPENLPKYIAGLPWKMNYVDGEPIIIQDGEIKAYKEVYSQEGRNTLWTSPEYPDGGIPRNELSVSPTIATHGDDFYIAESSLVNTSFKCASSIWVKFPSFQYTYSFVSGYGLMTCAWYTPRRVCDYVVFGSSVPNTKVEVNRGGDEKYIWTLTRTSTYNGHTVYYAGESLNLHNPAPIDASFIQNKYADRDKIAWTMIYGNIEHVPYTQYETVKWQRPVDGLELTNMFGVFVE